MARYSEETANRPSVLLCFCCALLYLTLLYPDLFYSVQPLVARKRVDLGKGREREEAGLDLP